MPKEDRERRRRRRKALDEGGQDVAATSASETSDDVTANHEAERLVEDTDSVPAEAVNPIWHESQSAAESGAAPSSAPAAVAQILAPPPVSRGNTASNPAKGPAADPFFARFAEEPVHSAPEPDAPPPPPEQVYADAEPPDSSTHDYGRERSWTREPVLLALLLVALIVLAFDTYFMLRLNGLSDRLAATKPAAAATATAERPWVGVDSIRTAAFANGGQPVTTVHIVNSGREPAYDLRSNTVGSLRSSATPAPQIPTQKGPLATTGMLLPNTGGNLTFFANTRALTSQEAASVRSGQFVLWLAGRLDYKDSKKHPHLTTFRYRYNPQLNSFIAAPDGNSAN